MMSVLYKQNTTAMEELTQSSILKTLAYFSIFSYPLLSEEIKIYLQPGSGAEACNRILDDLVTDGSIFKIENFYLLRNDAAWIKRRRDGNFRAEGLLPKARKIGRFLSGFPYVRGIAISGSLSKNYADEKADIDFFVITKSNRLWIARTLMHIFKKLTFLAGKQHFYCMNYYLDEKKLKLDNQNIYTAVETITLLPVCGDAMNDFFTANSWVEEWFVDYPSYRNVAQDKAVKSWMKSAVEFLLGNKVGDWLDNQLMKLTASRWKKKKSKGMRNEEGNEMDLVTGKHFARSNPGMFQEKLLLAYKQRLEEISR
jgi:predicted nucleotidyltransferase